MDGTDAILTGGITDIKDSDGQYISNYTEALSMRQTTSEEVEVPQAHDINDLNNKY